MTRKSIVAVSAIILCSLISACLRERQTETLVRTENSKAFVNELRSAIKKTQTDDKARAKSGASEKTAIFCLLREGDSFSVRGSDSQVAVFAREKLRSQYAYKTDSLSDHQKGMIDEFFDESIKKEGDMVRATETSRIDLIVVSYVRSYTLYRYLHFDVYDFKSGTRVGNIKYEMNKVTFMFEKKK